MLKRLETFQRFKRANCHIRTREIRARHTSEVFKKQNGNQIAEEALVGQHGAAGVLNGAAPRFVFAHGPDKVHKVGVCSGAASDLLEDAARHGCDLFLTGELAERAGELARELQITLVAAGHHATEVFGPQRIAEELVRTYPMLDVRFVNVASPI